MSSANSVDKRWFFYKAFRTSSYSSCIELVRSKIPPSVNNLNFDAGGKDKSKIDDVQFMFEKHFKPRQSALQSWYQLGSIYSSQFEDQTDFMSNLHDVANDCSSANKVK